MEFDPFFDAFLEMDFGPGIPDARPDAKTTLASLPAELLLDITDYLRYGEVYVLMTVNKLLHEVALQRFYANVYVDPKKIKFPVEIDLDSPLEEIIRQTTLKKLGVIGGLLARKEHLHTLKLFHLITMPTDSERFLPLISTLMRAVISRASKLRDLSLPHLHLASTLCHSSLAFPVSFSTLALCVSPNKENDNHTRSVQDLIERARPRILKILNWAPAEAIKCINKTVGLEIEVFSAEFDLENTAEASSETLSRLIVEKMPNLIELTIGVETSTPTLDVWHQAMTEDIINSLYFIVRSLGKLEELTIHECCVIGWKREEELIGQLSSFSPSLKSITLVDSGYSHEFLYERSCRALQWRKWQVYGEQSAIWSPYPHERQAKDWWEAKFGTSEIIRMMISKMWPGIGIPYYWCH